MNFFRSFSVFFLIAILVPLIPAQDEELSFEVRKSDKLLQSCKLQKLFFENFKLYFDKICDDHLARKEAKTKIIMYQIQGNTTKMCPISEDARGVQILLVHFCVAH